MECVRIQRLRNDVKKMYFDIEQMLVKIDNNGMRFNGKFPVNRMLSDGKYSLVDSGGWLDGFYVGIFNMAYAITKDRKFLKHSQKYDSFINARMQCDDEKDSEKGLIPLGHDIGFLALPTVGLRYSLTKSKKDEELLLKGADALMRRYNEKGKFIRAWDAMEGDSPEFAEEKKGKAIIDSMMNLPLLFKASEITGDESYYNVAYSHAKTMQKYILREDFSTYHTYNFNPKTGEPIGGKTVQGYSDCSCWSRGQSWAVYGFALAYKYTKEISFLVSAQKAAMYFMNNLTALDMPCWDFAVKNERFAPWDSSAAAICASGLMEISEQLANKSQKEFYEGQAKRLLNALYNLCSTHNYPSAEPFLLHGCSGPAFKKEGFKEGVIPNADQPMVFGDYFLFEALFRQHSKLRVF